MLFKIAVMDGNAIRCHNLCQWLENHNYLGIEVHSFDDLTHCMTDHQCAAAIIDIESTGIHDRAVRSLVRVQPDMQFLLISQRTHHPELKDSLSHDVRACLMRPVDFNELLLWLQSFESQHVHSGGKA